MGPAAGARSLYHLGIGDDHRGATWFDAARRIVWLCAGGAHRSGSEDDFFQTVRPLILDGTIYPTTEDEELAGHERRLRFAEIGPRDAAEMIAVARSAQGQTLEGNLAQEFDVRVKVSAGNELDEVYVAFQAEALGNDRHRINLVISCFDPAGELYPDFLDALPGEQPVAGEIVMLIVRDSRV